MKTATETSPVWAAMLWIGVAFGLGYDLIRCVVFGVSQMCDPSHVLPLLSTKL